MPSTAPAVQRPSKTAELAAVIRAVHLRRVRTPVFKDELALAMCGPFWRTVVSSRLLSWLVIDIVMRRLAPISPAVFTRARFGEDCLEAVIGQGVEQYVIVGAGYETFPMRRHDLMERLSVYELDLPATQELKRARMRKAGIPIPEGLRYVAADLNAEPLHDALGRAGFDASRRTLFSWFGVTYYLGKDAIRETLESIAGQTAPGSSVMFDYLADPSWTPADWQSLQQRCADLVARHGEPWLSSFDPAEIPDFLAGIGYSEVNNLAPDRIGGEYFSANPDLVYPPVIGFCHAATPTG